MAGGLCKRSTDGHFRTGLLATGLRSRDAGGYRCTEPGSVHSLSLPQSPLLLCASHQHVGGHQHVGRPRHQHVGGHHHVGRPRHQHVGRLRHPHLGCAHHQHVCRARLFAKRADYVRESAACLALVIWRRRDSTRAVPCTVVPQGTQMILSQGAESSTNPLCSLFTFSAGAQKTKRSQCRGVCWGKGSNRTGLLATEGASSGTTPL